MTQRDGMGTELGGGFRMGNTCKSMADSYQCMANPLQYCKVISLQLIKIIGGWGKDFPGGLDGKVSVYKCGRPGVDPWVGKIPWRRKRQSIPVFLTRKSHGWRSLVQATVHGLAKSWARLSYFPSFPSFID